jgi:hypothetical protein
MWGEIDISSERELKNVKTGELATLRTLHTLNLEQDELGGASVLPALHYHSMLQTNIRILNYDKLEPQYIAQVGHLDRIA